MRLGVCYYPEHWDEALWPEDARRMNELGLEVVRIGEFAWSKIEPKAGCFDWGWLDRSVETLSNEGLSLIIGTPTATPPKWLIDAHPEILGWDKEGRPRNFGSRRHYCFSSSVYRAETKRIVAAIAERYGEHEAVTGWQTDNEYGCHDTVRSYSPAALNAFREWLSNKYDCVDNLNDAWGTTFWSQTYSSFDEVNLPNLTVTEPNPSHVLDFYRFSSDQVISYNKLQVDILNQLSPGRDIYHNFMGFFTDFDHFELSEDVDVAGWDSYPLGFLDVGPYCQEDKQAFMRQGHPDFCGFHHDLYRGCGKDRFAVLEQQPGPVNWAQHNPAPMPGMVRTWTHEAAAHGAELVSYFRWRQAPFAQEQMHAGLLRPDNEPAPAYAEIKETAKELKALAPKPAADAQVALIFSYETQWMSEIHPQGANWNYLKLAYDWYSVARRFGLNLDIVKPGADLSSYSIVLAPSLFHVSEEALEAFEATKAQIVFGPRSDSKTANLHVPNSLPPGVLNSLLPLKIFKSESLPAFHQEAAVYKDTNVTAQCWLDHVETRLTPLAVTDNGNGLLYQSGRFWLFTSCPGASFLSAVISDCLQESGLPSTVLDDCIRIRSTQDAQYVFNYGLTEISGQEQVSLTPEEIILGRERIAPGSLAVWRSNDE